MFQVSFIDFDYSAASVGYDLGVADVLDVIDLRAKSYGSFSNWPVVNQWEWVTSQDTDDFASGSALFVYSDGFVGQPIRVRYKKPFTQFSASPSTTDNVQDATGLYGQAHPILAMGAALRLAGVWEISRNLTSRQGDTRRAQEVPPGAKNAAPAGLVRSYNSGLVAESDRLKRLYPTRLRRLR